MASAIQSFGGGLPGVAYIDILGGQNGDTWWNLNEITIGTTTTSIMPFRIDWLNTVTGINQTYTNILTNQVQPNSYTNTDIGGATPPISYLTDGSSTTGITVNGTGFQGITTSRIRLARPDNLLSFSIVNCTDNLASRMWNCRVTVYSLNNTILDQYTLPASLWTRNTAGFWSYTKTYVTSQIAPISAPTQVPSCVLWLDGADASSFVLSGSNVTTWNDKSGQGYNTSNLTGTPTYSSNGVNFTGTQAMGTNLGYAATLSNSTMFCITSYTSAFNGAFIETNVAGGNNGSGLDFFVTGGQQRVNGWATGTIVNGASGLTVNTRNMHELTFATGSTGIAILYLDGSLSGTNNSINFTYTAGGLFTLGNWKNGGSYGTFFTGVINEVVVYSSILTTFQRQSVEGYLAWKWGLQGNLPAGHPFKNSPLGFFGFPLQLKMSAIVPVTRTSAFYGTGTIQSFTVPAGVFAIRFFLWGAGGVGQGNNFNAPTVGGGAYVEGNLATTPGTTYQIIVGRPEQSGLANGGGSTLGEGGGGFSGIFSAYPAANTVIAIAGGGGGSGYNANGYGGGGGYPNGSAGVQSGGGNQGGGGTQTAGGASLATAGSQLAGGNGGSGDFGGGGGGGGWYGGGGGTNQGGGGGGSSTYISTVFNPVTANGGNGGPTQVTPTPAGGEFSPFWISPYGRGGKDGLVVIGYQSVNLPQTVFTYTGADQTYVVPAGVTAIQTYIWGAGSSGAGAFANGVIRVTPGSTLTIMVGQAGYYGHTSKTYGGGGAGTGNSGSGGGRSAIMVGATDLVIVGGGGGQGYQFNVGGSATFSGTANSGATVGGTTATGGSQSAGGSVGGTLYFGGDGQSYAGGGGGGYYGGGGGQYVPGVGGGSGGGGSSYTTGPNYGLVEGVNSPDGTSAPASNYPGFRNNAGAAGANGLVILIPSPPAANAITMSFRSPSFTTATTFTYTGANQTFIVPPGVSTIAVYLWGAGGGGINANGGSASGAAGAMVQGVLRGLRPGAITVIVGQGGSTVGSTMYGGGGAGAPVGNGTSGAGGGRSAIQIGGADVVTAGGGGGAGYPGNTGGAATFSGTANDGAFPLSGSGTPGKGGTQTAGGAAGGNFCGSGNSAGSKYQGGYGGGWGCSAGGGGGGGWYGGGGGGSSSGSQAAGGGGGSSYIDNLILIPGQTVFGFNSSNGNAAPNTSSPYYGGGAAAGGTSSNPQAGHGRVVIVY